MSSCLIIKCLDVGREHSLTLYGEVSLCTRPLFDLLGFSSFGYVEYPSLVGSKSVKLEVSRTAILPLTKFVSVLSRVQQSGESDSKKFEQDLNSFKWITIIISSGVVIVLEKKTPVWHSQLLPLSRVSPTGSLSRKWAPPASKSITVCNQSYK